MQEYRLRRQESLQAIENELKAEEKPARKKSKKSSIGNNSYYFMQYLQIFYLQDIRTNCPKVVSKYLMLITTQSIMVTSMLGRENRVHHKVCMTVCLSVS